MSISMLVRRAAAIGAAAIAVSGVIAGPALASAPRAPAPRHLLEKYGMYVAGFDPAVAKAHGYKIVTYANGDVQAVPINPRSGLPKGTLLKKVSASNGTTPNRTIRFDNSDYSLVPGDCGDSWLEGWETGPHQVELMSGFAVDLPAVKYRWTILLSDINGNSEQGASGWLAEDSSWSGTWSNLTQYVWTQDEVENSSYAELTDGEICYSAGPMIIFDVN
jgi:hypothetical protein